MRNSLKITALSFALAAGCQDRGMAQVCTRTVQVDVDQWMPGGNRGLDLLVVVDTAPSMAEEQKILPSHVYGLIEGLFFPLEDSWYKAVSDMRIAVVTSDMGVQVQGGTFQGDSELLEQLGCTALGDNGAFKSYPAGKTIELLSGTIPCDGSNAQCPGDWLCQQIGDAGAGLCHSEDGSSAQRPCPGVGTPWSESPVADTCPPERNPDLALEAACQADLGSNGCAVSQPLKAALHGLLTNPGFVRRHYRLAVLIISDKDDCSVGDPGFFEVEELQDLQAPGEASLACGRHQALLGSLERYATELGAVKKGYYDVYVSAVVGVPPSAQSPGCEGGSVWGTWDIEDCLGKDEMQLEEWKGDSGVSGWKPACERVSDGGELLARATPSRRLVEMFAQAHVWGHLHSICSQDWAPVAADLARAVSYVPCGGSYCPREPLPWNSSTHKAQCRLEIPYEDLVECPFELEPDHQPAVEHWVDDYNGAHTTLYCPIPLRSAPLDCDRADEVCSQDCDTPGWFFCEDHRESFESACDPAGPWSGVDEDEDGLVDCQDPDCWRCSACEGQPGVDPTLATSKCNPTCRFDIKMTRAAKDLAWNKPLRVSCVEILDNDDPNCAVTDQRTD